ncbi:meprin A subunit beta [Oncorhynchus mykiss]|uniref:meprin A subunit beta n=1 Tax=Oncorhynchus mykiss TaxID=8022 RepID=UPI0018788755|nr:meprin A subunit beta [Oncorhynchus mykiss]
MASKWIVLVFSMLWCLSASSRLTGETETDVDEGHGHDWDIFDINKEAGLDLLEGDIVIDETDSRNTILGEQYRWPQTVPYYLKDSLDINAKGVILKAFEQYRLKTCINFVPWKGENNYISVFKGTGCYSSVGNRQVGKQKLSIGRNCDRLATVEHEFLHALGFWHEQSRADRDDYVNIMWDRIEEGKEHNFLIHGESVSSALNVPYDYGSVMHYSKTAFNIGSEPSIITKIPSFMDVIGQRVEFSDSDLLKLNRLYNCTTSSTFLDSCSFEKENICGMIQGPVGKAQWEHRHSVAGGPNTDYTNMGQCDGKGYFMHFSTVKGNHGDQANLESRLFYPKRGSQCLQFYLHNSGGADDRLNVWVREYDDANPKGKLRLIQKIDITGGIRDSWELYHVTLDVKMKFRVKFEGLKGTGASTGGLSLDDINLSETTCPQHIWRIRDFAGLLETTPTGVNIYSPRFLSPSGYSFMVSVYINGRSSPGSMAIYFHLTSGPKDDSLTWPCPWHQATMALMDQNPDIRQRMSNHRMITTDPNKLSSDGNDFYWDNPLKVGSLVNGSDGSQFYRGPGTGTSSYLTHSRLKSRNFIKGDDAIFLLGLEDVSALLETQPLPHSAVHQSEKSAVVSPSRETNTSTVVMAVFMSLAAVMFVVAMVSAVYTRRVRRPESDRDVIVVENI